MTAPPAALVEFHTGIVQPVAHVCQTLRRLQPSPRTPVLVTAPATVLVELDRALWTVLERDFIAHGIVGAQAGAMPSAMAARTPVWLAVSTHGLPVREHAWWVNVGAEAPDRWPAPKAIEVVAEDPQAAGSARERWRAYRQQGLRTEHLPRGVAAG